ncbi:alpha/beta hydrolase family protein [Flavobacterium sp.]|uniref:alpha/beta hydrolase family protein n=1 Tax=Flavobacterium sp. TaxID=239 RepID=UPI003D6C05A7
MLLISKKYAFSQKTTEDFGYRHLSYKFQDDRVDLIIISKPGEEKIEKPLFFFCQGSLPRPLVIYNEKGLFGVLPFNESPFLKAYHIIIVGKPGVPVISNATVLGKDFMYLKNDKNEAPPKGYTDRNYLDYYVFRNNFILKQLLKERWAAKSKLVVCGHSEGSSIAAKMAFLNPKITQLIYSGGNPFGKITAILSNYEDKQEAIHYWEKVVENANTINYDKGESYKAIYSFSLSQREHLLKLNIPILITYDLKDTEATYNSLFQAEAIRERKRNFRFMAYPGLAHDFLSVNEESAPNYENWNKVAKDWLVWLNVKVK